MICWKQYIREVKRFAETVEYCLYEAELHGVDRNEIVGVLDGLVDVVVDDHTELPDNRGR